MLANEIEDKIGVLNQAMAGILPALAGLDPAHGQTDIGVVAFGGTGARVHLPLRPASAAAWTDLTAGGKTPMGAAFGLARQMLDAPGAMPEDSLEPVLVLVSDGVPTDDWEPALDGLLASEHGVRALRIAIGIGTDRMPDAQEVLDRFASPEIGVLQAEQAHELPRLLERVVTATRAMGDSIRAGFWAPTLEELDRI